MSDRIDVQELMDLGEYDVISYYARGHVDKGAFAHALMREFEYSAPVDDVRHTYYRNVPHNGREVDYIVIESGQGRGAYPVTAVYPR